MEQETLFALNSVAKRYGATTALREVSLTVDRGEVIGLIGANGAGKSTLTRVVSGVSLPDAGELFHDGRQIDFAPTRRQPPAGLAYALYTKISHSAPTSRFSRISAS